MLVVYMDELIVEYIIITPRAFAVPTQMIEGSPGEVSPESLS